VLPLNKINHLWDVLFTLPVEPTFPLFIGLAILQNLRSALLGAEFNDCISLFQEISDMDIPKIMEAAWLIRQHTPNSIVSDVGLAPMERQSALNLAPEINGSKMSVQLPQSPTKEYRMEELNRTLRNYNDDSDDEDALKQQFGGSGGPLSPYEQSLRWWNRPTPAEVRLNEMVPRISLEDLLRMDQRACVIDLRSMDEFKSGHYPQSIGVHASDTAYFVSVLNMQRYRYFIIIAERGGAGPKV
jgi:hypothetical protein